MQAYSEKAISKVVKRLEENKNRIKLLNEQNEELNKKIKSYYFATAEDEIVVDDGSEKNLKAKVVSQTRVRFFADKMKEKLGKKVFRQLCKKEYTVDEDELKNAIAEYPQLKSILKRFLRVSYTPDNEKISEFLRNGKITNTELKGCYSAEENFQVRVSRVAK